MGKNISQITEALEDFKSEYAKRVRIGSRPFNVSKIFLSTRSRIIQRGLSKGMKVYALPLHNGKGMFEKWMVDNHGKFIRLNNRLQIIEGNTQIASALVCSGKAKFIGSDEIFVEGNDSIEGVRRKEALDVFKRLKINPKRDAYVLFIRTPQDAKNSVREFRMRLSGIFREGGNWRPSLRLKLPNDPRFFKKFIGQMVRQLHPLVAEALIRDYLSELLNVPFLRAKIEPSLRTGVAALEKNRRVKGIKPSNTRRTRK